MPFWVQLSMACLPEIPGHLPKKRDILKVYSDDEYNRIIAHLDEAEGLSFRNKAITILAMNRTGCSGFPHGSSRGHGERRT